MELVTKKQYSFLLIGLLLAIMGGTVALAAEDTVSIGELFPGQEQFIPENPSENAEEGLPTQFFFQVITLLMQVIGAVALIVFVIGGLLLIVAEGEENRISAGKNMVKFGIIGLVIALASYFIAVGIQAILLTE